MGNATPTTSATRVGVADDEFATLYRSSLSHLVGFFRAKGIGHEEAADLAHETVLRTLLHLKRHGRTRDDIGPLTRTIARNLLIERIRKAGPKVLSLSDEMDAPDEAPGPSDLALQAERQAAVRAAMTSLTPRHRRVIELWMQGLSPADIARELGIKRNAADAILHRARRTLASRLGPKALWGGIVLAWLRTKTQVKHSTQALASWSPDSAALAPTGVAVATVGLVAVLGFSGGTSGATPGVPAAPANRITVQTGSDATPGDVRSVVDRAGEVVTDATSALTPTKKVSVGLGPKRNNASTVGVDVEFVRDPEDRGLLGPLIEGLTVSACRATTGCLVSGR